MDDNSPLRWLTAAVVLIAVATVVGLMVLWPSGPAPDLGIRPTDYVDASVTSVREAECESIEVPGAVSGCRKIDVEVTSGANSGAEATVTVSDTQFDVPAVSVGDSIVLLDSPASPEEFRYSFVDFQRRSPLIVLAAVFAFVVIAVGRWRGARALLGLVASVGVLVVFIVPALLRGSPALAVALVGTATVAYFALYLAHGFNPATTVALAGTLLSLALIAVLSVAAASAANLFGLSDEAAQTIRVTAETIDLRGLLVAGFVVGALGVLDDVTVTQVSTVQALRRTRPDIDRRSLYREAIRVGRDHIASTVNTLVLAYAGAALPLLLFFAQGATSVGRILTGELVAVEISRMLVGSIGLVLSVPVTTALAAVVLTSDHADLGHDHGASAGDDVDDQPPRAGSPRGRRREPPLEERRPPRWEDFGPEE